MTPDLVSRSHCALIRSHETSGGCSLMVSPPLRGETVRPPQSRDLRREEPRALDSGPRPSPEPRWTAVPPRSTAVTNDGMTPHREHPPTKNEPTQ